MKTNVSTLALNIHKSKLTMQVLQGLRAKEIYFYFIFFFVILSRISFTNICLDGKQNEDFVSKLDFERMELQQKIMALAF